MQLSKLEDKSIEILRRNKLEIFRIRDLSLLMNRSKTDIYNLIKSLKKKNAIETIKSGIYALKGTNEFIIGTNLNWPSYVSFWSALSYYGLSDQMPKKIFLASTKYHQEIKNFKYVTLSKDRFFGYIKLGDIIIAEKEKTIIDSLLFPKYSGGIKEITSAIEKSLPVLDIKKLVGYALKIKSKAVIRRLGYILEINKINDKYIKELRSKIGKGYEKLDPTLKEKNNFNKTWLLDVNIT